MPLVGWFGSVKHSVEISTVDNMPEVIVLGTVPLQLPRREFALAVL